MIPTYLQGKSSMEIAAEVVNGPNADRIAEFLHMAILHALCAAETNAEPEAQGRAVAFLNIACPQEVQP